MGTKNGKTTPRTPEQLVWSWHMVEFILPLLIGGGISFMTSHYALIADGFFIAGAILFLSKLYTLELPKEHIKKRRIITTIIMVIVAGCIWSNHYISRMPPSKLILSIEELSIVDSKGGLTMDLLFHNDGTKEFIIDNIFMLIAGNHILPTLNDNDTIFNNFNNKAKLEYKRPDGKIIAPAGYYGMGALKSGFPRVLKSAESYPLKITVPFVVDKYFKEQKLVNIKKIPIGLQMFIINYKGQKYEIYAYPVAELHILNDIEIKSIYYNSPTTFTIEIEKYPSMSGRGQSVIMSPGGVVPPPNLDILK